MHKRKKTLLVVDLAETSGAGATLEGVVLEDDELVVYHVADYSEAIRSASGYDETTLSGAGITPVTQFIEERRNSIRRFLGMALSPDSANDVQIELDPHPARKILEKAEQERVDLILIYQPQEKRFDRIVEYSTAEQVVRSSSRPVVTSPSLRPSSLTRTVHEAA